MALFKKKQPREIREDDSTFVKLWYNPRTHALMILGVYFIFFLIVIIIINVGSQKNVNDEIKGSSTKELFTNLENKYLTYNYVINNGNSTYYFSGNYKHNNISGTLLKNGIITPIKVENNECDVGTYNENDEYIPFDELCPGDINYKYFDYNYIYGVIENLSTTKYKKGEYYIFNINDDTNYKLHVSDNKLDKIVITAQKSTYTLEYSINEEEFSSNQSSESVNEE